MAQFHKAQALEESLIGCGQFPIDLNSIFAYVNTLIFQWPSVCRFENTQIWHSNPSPGHADNNGCQKPVWKQAKIQAPHPVLRAKMLAPHLMYCGIKKYVVKPPSLSLKLSKKKRFDSRIRLSKAYFHWGSQTKLQWKFRPIDCELVVQSGEKEEVGTDGLTRILLYTPCGAGVFKNVGIAHLADQRCGASIFACAQRCGAGIYAVPEFLPASKRFLAVIFVCVAAIQARG